MQIGISQTEHKITIKMTLSMHSFMDTSYTTSDDN